MKRVDLGKVDARDELRDVVCDRPEAQDVDGQLDVARPDVHRARLGLLDRDLYAVDLEERSDCRPRDDLVENILCRRTVPATSRKT